MVLSKTSLSKMVLSKTSLSKMVLSKMVRLQTRTESQRTASRGPTASGVGPRFVVDA
jgi:hypothetical protein